MLSELQQLLANFGIGLDQVLAILVGLIAIPLINFLKQKYQVDGRIVTVIAAVVAVVLAIPALFLFGVIGLADFQVGNLAEVFTIILTTARLVYELILQREPVS